MGAVRSSILLLLGAVLIALGAVWLHSRTPSVGQQVAEIQQSFIALEQRTTAQLLLVESQGRPLSEMQAVWNDENIGFVHYKAGKAVAWSSVLFPFAPSVGPRGSIKDGLVQLANGWYICKTRVNNDEVLVAYALVQTTYGYENRYISSAWNPALNVDADHRMSYSATGTHVLKFANGTEAGHVRLAATTAQLPLASAIMWLLAGLLAAIALWRLANVWEKTYGAAWVAGGFALGLIALRGIMLYAAVPSAWYGLPLFGPEQYASSALTPSLGDLLLHVLCALVVVLRVQRIALPQGNKLTSGILVLAQLVVWPVLLLLHTLVVDAAFPLDLNMPFALTWYSILALGITFIVLVCYYLVVRWLLGALPTSTQHWSKILVPFLVGWMLSAACAWGKMHHFVGVGMGAVVVGFMLAMRFWGARLQGFSLLTPTVVVFSIFATVVLQLELHTNEHERRETLARRLTLQQDPITEYLFKELETEITSNRDLRNSLAQLPESDEKALRLVRNTLSYDHWNRYKAVINIYDANGHLLATDQTVSGPNYHEIEQQFAASQPTLSANLRYTGNWETNAGYLARMTISGRRTQPDLVLYIALTPQGTGDAIGFTDLFIDEGVSLTQAIEGYSFARYQNGELKAQAGEYRYSLNANQFDSAKGDYACIVSDGEDHLVFRPYDDAVVVVSRRQQTLLGHLTIFSYLFLFYFGCAVLLSLVTGAVAISLLSQKSFRNRINLAMAGMITVSLLVIGLLTVYYVVHEYSTRSRIIITEKSQSVLIELEHKLSDKTQFEPQDRELLSVLLSKFSKVFFTDINLYGLDGSLLATSRPRLFGEGLMAEAMDAVAFEAMTVSKRSSFVQSERIGKLDYQAAYVPFRNDKDEIIAYLSLPYFAQQYGLQQEVISLLAALINIYVFLIVIAVVLALVISNRITEPLRIIRDGLRDLRLDKANRAIEWNSQDEIGELVKEYNRTLRELVRNAEMLARSERESAWREMAKQVAHEIKNPLTPMKLNIQMLERSYRDGAPDMGERIERMSRTLIEQIDALSNIASEFSNFAQMPQSVLVKVDVCEVMESITSLYQDASARVLFGKKPSEKCYVMADKEQLLRVFNNLIKNALQAIPENRVGAITLCLVADGEQWIASVQDKGSGIPEELRNRVFVPNFTTKSAGMGLGLAMVQRIVESANGRIWFETESGVGTTFFVALPRVD